MIFDNDTIGMGFGRALKTKRRLMRVSLKEVAELADTSPSRLLYYETGRAQKLPGPKFLKRICKAYGVNIVSMLTTTGYLNKER